MKKFLSVLLSLTLLLSLLPNVLAEEHEIVKFTDMAYSRPNADELQQLLDEACTLARGSNANAILAGVLDFYDAYDWLSTCAALADIYYSADLSSSYWAGENDYCLRLLSQADQMADTLYRALAQSPCRSKLERKYFGIGYFAAYDGESVWDEHMLELTDRENDLISQYYAQCGEEDQRLLHVLFPNPTPRAETLVELIRVRNEMAACCGYDSYEDLANELYYYRDYTSDQTADYLENIRRELVPLYRQCMNCGVQTERTTESRTLAFLGAAAEQMGGTIWDAFDLMQTAGLYHISAGKNKYNASFETYLYSYDEPFLFVNPQQDTYDYLTVSHEFGHFCNDYASFGVSAGIDVSEFFSQGMEYLVLCYGPDTEKLTKMKLLDSLSTFVEQACYTCFEREMYRIPDDELSVEALCSLYERTAIAFGFDELGFKRTEFTEITHFYTNPMYMFSYIVSNDAAMQLYELELETPGLGLAKYSENLSCGEPWLLAFLEQAGLESPFAAGRLEKNRDTFRQALLS